MAHYAAVASVVQLLDDIFCSNLYSRTEFVSKQRIMKSVFQKFDSLLDFLRYYSSRSGHEAAAAGRRIRDVAYRAQEILLQESNISSQISYWDEELVKLGELLDSAVEDLDKTLPNLQRISYSSSSSSPTASKLGTVPLVGLDHLVTKIQNQLCSYSDKLEVISIVGMTGIGKTTLATHIFHSELIVDHFDCRGWVTVSQNYNVNKLLQDLLNSLGVHYYGDDEDTEGLRERLYRVLKYRRYLIVVDDLWNVQVWDYFLWIIFPDDNYGSRIVCTTQCNDVAHYVASNGFVHEIPFLDEDNSWILLKQMVFLDKFNCPPKLEFVGRLVATKCGGLPLAIAQIAQILSSNACASEYWEHIARNMNSILGGDRGILFDALSRSYEQLTDQLKSCFLYVGSFLDGYDISVSNLVKLWVVELIVKSDDVNKTLEQVAQECLEVLIQRNLVLITKKTTRGRIKFCNLHDVVRNFCRQKACNENLLHATQDERGWLSEGQIDIIAFGRCKLLRVVGIVEVIPWSILNAVVQMFHLKYLILHLKCPKPILGLPPIPPSISMLQNLQTLIIHDSDPVPPLTLPPQIWKMTQLRHVIVTLMTLLPPISIVSDTLVQKLWYLQTLSTLKDFIFTDRVIEMIPNLRKLKIRYTGIDGNGRYMFYDHLDNLVYLGQLEELTIMVDTVPVFGLDSIWSNFAFPWRLTKLSIGGCKLPWEEMTMIGSLPNLQILKLREDSFVGETWKPNKGEFLTLKFLFLEMLDLKYWLARNTHFPSLECLKIVLCNDLKEIPYEFIHILDRGCFYF